VRAARLVQVAVPDPPPAADVPIQVRTPQGVRWAPYGAFVAPAMPLQAIVEEVGPGRRGAARGSDCVEVLGPADRLTAGEEVRVRGPGGRPGSLLVEVERGCRVASGRTFRNVSVLDVAGPVFEVRVDAADPCADVPTRVPEEIRALMMSYIPDHPALCKVWRVEAVSTPFFPGARSQTAFRLEEDVVVPGEAAFTGWVVDGTRVPGDVVTPEATFGGRDFTLVAATSVNCAAPQRGDLGLPGRRCTSGVGWTPA
jgi:hypothetical protein